SQRDRDAYRPGYRLDTMITNCESTHRRAWISLAVVATAIGLLAIDGRSHGADAPPSTIAEDGQWPLVAKDYQNRRYSGLAQIDTSNVAGLKVAWTFSTGIPKGHEAPPLVVGDTMYVVTPFPNNAYAFDLRNP